MPWAGNGPTDRILMHLAEIGAGRCTITDDTVTSERDPEMSRSCWDCSCCTRI